MDARPLDMLHHSRHHDPFPVGERIYIYFLRPGDKGVYQDGRVSG